MPDPRYDKLVQPGLLDRLIDENPDIRAEAPITRAESLRRFRASIKRDLEWLLNTIQSGDSYPAAYREIRKSILTYGLPDVSGFSLQNKADEFRLLRTIEEVIENFEPRLKRIRVTNPSEVSSTQQAIVFHVDALLMMDPAPERIAFDTVLEVGKGAYTVKES
ncbi:MAG TPA: type VI secretion system baseplate subunit TssE [Bryobacteraceae bacterium]|jgi:type VI secretion system protein ImpF|nr:type VI secretion system baseplate subunit TssE [Bryobacteraceae bacterium]